MRALPRVLRRCVVETYQRSAEAKFLLGGSRNRNRDALATAEEIEAAEEGPGGPGGDGDGDEGTAEGDDAAGDAAGDAEEKGDDDGEEKAD